MDVRPVLLLLLLKISTRSFRRRGESIRQTAEIAVIIEIVDVAFARRPRLAALREGLRRLRRGDQPKIMLRMLQIVFSGDRIASGMRIPGKLEIFLSDMMRVAANLDVGTV